MKEEIWTIIKVTGKTTWEISDQGNVKKNNKPYEPKLGKHGYLRTSIGLVHRLVALAYVPNPENKPCVDHIDGNRFNNKAENLRWVTYSENMRNPNTYYEWLPKVQNNKQGDKNPCYGKTRSEESKQKQRDKMLGRKASTETKDKMRIAMQDMKWIHLGEVEKLIHKEYLDYWLDDGWLLGRKSKKLPKN